MKKELRDKYHELLDKYLDLPDDVREKGAQLMQVFYADIVCRDGVPTIQKKRYTLIVRAGFEITED